MTPMGSMLNFDADVKRTTAHHQCENSSRPSVMKHGGSRTRGSDLSRALPYQTQGDANFDGGFLWVQGGLVPPQESPEKFPPIAAQCGDAQNLLPNAELCCAFLDGLSCPAAPGGAYSSFLWTCKKHEVASTVSFPRLGVVMPFRRSEHKARTTTGTEHSALQNIGPGTV